MTLELNQLQDLRETVNYLLDNGDFSNIETAYNSATNSLNVLDEVINSIKRCKAKCECGGNERVALDCTMKPCKHPKYN